MQRLTDTMAHRGPDAQSLWVDGAVGLGHTLLRTTDDAQHERQPCRLDGSDVWIVADARLDGRRELVARLQARGVPALDALQTPDVTLILHAYRAWGEQCVRYLLGDFSFVVWDGSARRLFCARDPLGLKLFYYARVGASVLVSNTLDCLRAHPLVSNRLNERAIGDFLLARINFDLHTTAFADIRRLPGGYTLTVEDATVREREYWKPPGNRPIRYRKGSDYVDHFIDLMQQAVGDRLRTEHVTLLMSGGMDSTAIAATAVDAAARAERPLDLQARTGVFRRALADTEQSYAQLVADAVGIPIKYIVLDELNLGASWQTEVRQAPEPLMLIIPPSVFYDHLDAGDSRVLLVGHGSDIAMGMLMPSLARLLTTMSAPDAAIAAWWTVRMLRRAPAVGLRPGQRIDQWRSRGAAESPRPGYPVWIDDGFAQRVGLRERWREVEAIMGMNQDVRREYARREFRSAQEVAFQEWWDPGVTKRPLDVRFPFLDVRLVEYLLTIPPVPWCAEKTVLRLAMRRRLPQKVLQRPKTSLSSNPLFALLSDDRLPREAVRSFDELRPYIDVEAFVRAPATRRHGWQLPPTSHLLSLGLWLRRVQNE